MSTDGKLDVVLFALTGFGNPVLNALLDDRRCRVSAVFTVKYKDPFPYYPEQQLGDLCAARDVACHFNVKVGSSEGLALLRAYAPDLIVVATFKQILSGEVLGIPRLGTVNFHPSLLPRYRGPCPTNAALLHDETTAGVTAHFVTEGLDDGNILLQHSTTIETIENDGQLRQRLAEMSGAMAPNILELFLNPVSPAGTPQNHSLATFAPKPTAQDGFLEAIADIDTIRRKVRAYNPLPGTSLQLGDRRVAVDRYALLDDNGSDGLYEHGGCIDIVANGKTLRLYKKIDAGSEKREIMP